MAKSIIFCADGTWDSPQETDQGLAAPTNVTRFYDGLLNDGTTQVAYYDDGVGTSSDKLVDLFEGVTGAGLAVKIMDGYQYIMNQHEEGDLIYLFGFSRGAYTVRCLADMIGKCGLLSKISGESNSDQKARILEAYLSYRKNTFDFLSFFKKKHSYKDVPIQMVGVWDTVGALGIPLTLFSSLNYVLFNFHNTILHENVRFGYQALAIDEEREKFKPALWETRQGVEQVWFIGAHGDVGGGYAAHGLSDIALNWMMTKALNQGIRFVNSAVASGVVKITGNPYDIQHFPSQKFPFSLLETAKRVIPEGAKIHSSVQQRMMHKELNYNPANLPVQKEFVDVTYSIALINAEK
jgi:uncharacterized protein (DUF2235 family)